MGPQPGSDALLAKENLRARFLMIYVGAPAAVPPPPSARHENGWARDENGIFLRSQRRRDLRCINRQQGTPARSATIKYGETSRRQTTGI